MSKKVPYISVVEFYLALTTSPSIVDNLKFKIKSLGTVTFLTLNSFKCTTTPLTRPIEEIDSDWNCVIIQNDVDVHSREETLSILKQIVSLNPEACVLCSNASNHLHPVTGLCYSVSYTPNLHIQDTTFNTWMAIEDFLAEVNKLKLTSTEQLISFAKDHLFIGSAKHVIHYLDGKWYAHADFETMYPILRKTNNLEQIASYIEQDGIVVCSWRGTRELMDEHFGDKIISHYLRRLADDKSTMKSIRRPPVESPMVHQALHLIPYDEESGTYLIEGTDMIVVQQPGTLARFALVGILDAGKIRSVSSDEYIEAEAMGIALAL